MPPVSRTPRRRQPSVGGDAAIVIRQARWKTGLLLLGSSAAVALGAVMIRDPQNAWGGWLNIVFFGGCAAVAAAQRARRSRLTLSPAGLRLEHLGRDRFWAWGRIGGFHVNELAGRTRLVGFFDLDAPPEAARRALQGEAAVGDASLPPSWAIAPEALAELLEDCRARWA